MFVIGRGIVFTITFKKRGTILWGPNIGWVGRGDKFLDLSDSIVFIPVGLCQQDDIHSNTRRTQLKASGD